MPAVIVRSLTKREQAALIEEDRSRRNSKVWKNNRRRDPKGAKVLSGMTYAERAMAAHQK